MRILYLSGCFPLLSETFTIYEIADLIRSGADVRILSLQKPVSGQSDLPDKLGFADKISYRPDLATSPFSKIGRIFSLLLKSPSLGDFLRRACMFLSLRKDASFSRYVLLETIAAADFDDWKPDVVHCHFGPNGRVGSDLKNYRLTDAVLTVIFHGYDISQLPKEREAGFYGTLFKTADHIFSINEYYLEKLKELGAPMDRVSVFHMSVDCNEFSFAPRSRPSEGTIECVSVGRMTEKKGHVYLVNAFAQIIKQRPDLDIRLHLIGDGQLYEEIRSLVHGLGLQDKILLHGGLQHGDVAQFLKRSHILVLPSVTASTGDMEGIPVVLMEAMAMGIPVVSSYHSGIPELIEDGVSGFLVAERDDTGLAEKILYLIDHPELWTSLTEAARRKVEDGFNRQKQSQLLLNSFQNILNRP